MTGFTGSPLDRVDHIRSDPEGYAALRYDWRARLLVLNGLDPQLSDDGELVWTTLVEVHEEAEVVLLGVADSKPYFIAIPPHAVGAPMRSPAMFSVLSTLPGEQAAIFGTAHSLITWHNTHRFCPRCGSTTTIFRAGWGRKCDRCGTEHFPRTDPVVIMLAEYQGKVLVGRQSRFPPGNYSALAGFLEPGESIEEAVRRELMEESGVPTGPVRYVASQPWPFGGSQLMIACIAEALDDTITLDTKELEDAMWVSREDVHAALNGDPDARFKAPPPFAIANSLLTAWLEDQETARPRALG
ncbi:MAG: diphosphatase [Sphingomonadales bacterium]|nr:diphosphatase [Sphingomonadales bacterium]